MNHELFLRVRLSAAVKAFRSAAIVLVIALCFDGCSSTDGFKLQQRLPTKQNTQYGFYVKLAPLKRSENSSPTKTVFAPILTDWNHDNQIIFATNLWIVAASPYCNAKMEGNRVLIEIADRNQPSIKWLMELTRTPRGFSVTKTEGEFFANSWSDTKLPEKGAWPAL